MSCRLNLWQLATGRRGVPSAEASCRSSTGPTCVTAAASAAVTPRRADGAHVQQHRNPRSIDGKSYFVPAADYMQRWDDAEAHLDGDFK